MLSGDFKMRSFILEIGGSVRNNIYLVLPVLILTGLTLVFLFKPH